MHALKNAKPLASTSQRPIELSLTPLVKTIMMDCIFCKIAGKQIPAKIAFENDRLIAFHDLFPQAPTHLLIIPKVHFTTLNDVPASENALLGEMMTTAAALAKELGVDSSGYRVVMNCNQDGGQSVYHIHLHMLAGRRLNWPPG